MDRAWGRDSFCLTVEPAEPKPEPKPEPKLKQVETILPAQSNKPKQTPPSSS